jgi:hypothetical protein
MTEELKIKVKNFIARIGDLRKEIEDSTLDFGFSFSYPNDKGRTIVLVKPTDRDFLEIQTKTKISPQFLEKLDEKKEKKLFNILKKIFIAKELHHLINTKQKGYMIVSHYYFEENDIDLNYIHEIVKRIFFCDLYANGVIQEFSLGNFSTKSFESKPNFYT